MANRFNVPLTQWFNENGAPLAGGKLYFYTTGTTTPKDTYADSGLGTPNANPVEADADGIWGNIFLGAGDYKVVLTAADGDPGTDYIWTADPVIPIAASPVSSVGLSMPAGIFDVTNSPITSSGTIAVTFDNQSPNVFFAGPASGGAAAPAMRAIVEADLPVVVPRSYLVGMTLSRSTATSLGVAGGVCRDSTNVATITLPSGTIDCTTTGANGLDTGALANNTWYHAFAIAKTDGTVSRLASTSPTSPTMPSGYTLLRRLGSFRTDGSAQILAFSQLGDEFLWSVAVKDANAVSTGGTTAFNISVTVPTGVQVHWLGMGGSVSGSTNFAISSFDESDQAVSLASFFSFANISAGTAFASPHWPLRTNTSAQIRGRGDGTFNYHILTRGWIDRRGRDD